ncbi:chitinase [Streptomyces sp. WMMB 714]|uniref:chitinase n=1 Tax=Streptomyces sp. WMMB 714 TaxID=1286822 RepID=UPI0005F7ADD4|nr:chitinase [Streptomyces sp. WMMB 714]SCK54949.1 chitinase [Streptomyces sp. WMMB 714]
MTHEAASAHSRRGRRRTSRTSRIGRTSRIRFASVVSVAVMVLGSALTTAGSASAAGADRSGAQVASGTDGSRTAAGAFTPYVDVSLEPSYDLLGNAGETGVKEYNLAFVTSGGGCTPKWGGVQELGDNAVAQQVEELRAMGGDVRISFGGASGSELGLVCGSADELAKAYGEVVEAFDLKKADFDIEGAALPDTAANTRRAQAIAQLQEAHPDLDVSVTLPVLPEGLTPEGTALLENAAANGVDVSAVNIMAMDYGPSYDGDMGEYALEAATATQAQVKTALGIEDDAEAWRTVAVTPMIGVNDVVVEVFTPEDAAEVAQFAREKNLAWLSMWSATRDKPCPGGPKDEADATCSSIEQGENDFTRAFTG